MEVIRRGKKESPVTVKLSIRTTSLPVLCISELFCVPSFGFGLFQDPPSLNLQRIHLKTWAN